MSISKNCYIIYRHNTEWFLKTIEQFWESIHNCYVEPIGVTEVKRLKNDYFTISFDENGSPKIGEITAISRHKSSNICSISSQEGFNIKATFDHNFIKVPLEGFMTKGKIKDLSYIVKLKDISSINFIFSEFNNILSEDAYQIGFSLKKIFGDNYLNEIIIPNNILFNSQLKIVFSFIAGLIDSFGSNHGIGFYLPIKNNSIISQITFLLCRIGLQYTIKNGIHIDIVDNFNSLSELRSYLRSEKKYISSINKHGIVNKMPFLGEQLFEYIKKYNINLKNDKLNYIFKKNKVKKKKLVNVESYNRIIQQVSINKINKWHNDFVYETVFVEPIKCGDFVYDLTINSFSHIYITGDNGWCLLHNKRSKTHEKDR